MILSPFCSGDWVHKITDNKIFFCILTVLNDISNLCFAIIGRKVDCLLTFPEFAGDTETTKELLSIEKLDTALSIFKRWRHQHTEVLMIVDQFEELFTLNPPETQSRFAERLLNHWDSELGRFWQVIPREMLGRYSHPVTADETAVRRA